MDTMQKYSEKKKIHHRSSYKPVLITLAVTLVGCGGSEETDISFNPQKSCEKIQTGQVIGEGTVKTATLVKATATNAEFCEVIGTLQPKTTFVVRLPSQWNERTLYTGGGGFNGNLRAANNSLLNKGYATIDSTGGNDVPNTGNFALNQAALEDYAYLSVHRASNVGRKVIEDFYHRPGAWNYFEGCSNGGREGLISAQRWPQDFDGVIARAPAINYQNIFLGFSEVHKRINTSGSNLSQAKVQALHAAVLNACDANDGIADGIISNPKACSFNPNIMRCSGAETDSCLTDAQLETAVALYSPTIINGTKTAAGFDLGSEVAWNGTQTGEITDSLPRYSNLLADQWVKYFVAQDANASALTFDPVAYSARLNQLRSLIDSSDANLGAFKARQGKLILYHGLADSAISPKETVTYYEDVVKKMGGQAEADQFMNLYLNPGVAHCTGGPGADTVDLLTPLQDWVEKGINPNTTEIVAKKLVQEEEKLSRPLCTYPKVPQYKGSGSPELASSFSCIEPTVSR